MNVRKIIGYDFWASQTNKDTMGIHIIQQNMLSSCLFTVIFFPSANIQPPDCVQQTEMRAFLCLKVRHCWCGVQASQLVL